MKATLLKAVVCVTLVFAGVLNADLKAQDKFVTNDVMTGELVTSKVVYRHDGMLYPHMKHNFMYDDQNRVVEKETLKWDSTKKEWTPYTIINLTYTSDQVLMDYAKWSNKAKAYNDAKERTIYELNATNIPVAYQSYEWNAQGSNWKIVDDLKLAQADVLYVIN